MTFRIFAGNSFSTLDVCRELIPHSRASPGRGTVQNTSIIKGFTMYKVPGICGELNSNSGDWQETHCPPSVITMPGNCPECKHYKGNLTMYEFSDICREFIPHFGYLQLTCFLSTLEHHQARKLPRMQAL